MDGGVAPGSTTAPSGRAIATFLGGIAGLAACITLLFLGMRALLDVGGFCAEGGPYQIETHCPGAVVVVMPLGILGGLGSFLVAQVGASAVGGAYEALPALAWPALFLGLGWNFLDYGFNPPDGGGWAWGWLICGLLFWGLGGVPLVVGLDIAHRSFRATRRSRAGRARGPSSTRPPAPNRITATGGSSIGSAHAGATAHAIDRGAIGRAGAGAAAHATAAVDAEPAPEPSPDPDDLVDDLDRLARLHAEGQLDDAQFETAKDRLLDRTGSP